MKKTTRTLRSDRLARRIALAALVTLSTLLVVVLSSAQDEAPRVFGETIDVRVVNVEVVVTDRQGNRVYGLAPDDFRLFVDGREVGVEFFSEVQGGRAVETVASSKPSEAPSTLPRLEAGEAIGMSYLVFIDDFYTIKNERNRVIETLRQQIPRVRTEDRMAVIAFDGKRLDMLTSWTNNHTVLERVLDEALDRPSFGIFRRAERFPGFGLGASETGGGGQIANLERRVQFERVTTAAVSTLRSFAMPEGRKVMLMVTGEWPAASFFDTFGQGTLGASDTELRLASPIADTANLLGYTLYPIDTAGLRLTGSDVEAFGPAIFQPIDDPQTPFEIVLAPGNASGGSSEAFRAATLRHIANQTGGRALLGKERFDALTTVAEDSGSFYWLGFSTDRQLDDAHHRIRVELARSDLRVRARQGYRDLSRSSELAMMTQSALLFGNPLEATVLGVELGSPERKRRGRMEVPLRVAIPADEVTLLPTAGGYTAEVELRVAARDRDGDLSAMPIVPLRLTRPDAPEPGTRLYYETQLTLRRQKHQLVVSVHDMASGNTLTSIANVEP